MKQLKKIFCIVMTMAFIFAFACPASTADAATKSIKEGKWVTVSSTSTYYKVNVKGEGYITLTAKNKKGTAYFALLDSDKDFFSDPENLFCAFGTESIKVPVSKGTYYIRLTSEVEFGGKATVKYTFTPVKQPTNYCIENALTLKPGKYTKFYQTPGYSFDRFYKINLKTDKKITIKSKSEVQLYDDEGDIVDTVQDYDDLEVRIYKTKKLKAGTYYIQAQYMYYDVPSIYKVKWQ